MKLNDFMRQAELSDVDMAGKLGCSEGAVRKWRYGERTPRPEQIARIQAATDGQVTANDFMPAQVSAA